MPVRVGSRDSQDGEGWKLVTFGTRRKVPAPPQNLQLQNRFSALIANKSLGPLLKKAPKPAKLEPCRSTRRKQQVIVMGDSLLSETKAPICQPHPPSRKVYADLGCCRKTAKACQALGFLPPAAFSCRHQG